MRIGMVGLGRMGAGMARRLLRGGHEVVAFDIDAAAVTAVAESGAQQARSLAEVVAALRPPRTVWMMVPAGEITATTVQELTGMLEPGDCLVDGGNSRWTTTRMHAAAAGERGIDLIDAGTSGGVWGLEEGYCLMVGGAPAAVARLGPVLDTLAPPDGWAHVGPSGAGHFTKMVHNGVEYALMQAYAEGFELLDASEYDIDLAQVAELWRHGSVVRSWLLELGAAALRDDPGLARVEGYVEDSGEGRWTVEAAIDAAVPTPAIAAALFARFASRRPDAFGNRMLAALRQQFGGHAVRRRDTSG
jgi:6-phosphogluconate dehydrogenase